MKVQEESVKIDGLKQRLLSDSERVERLRNKYPEDQKNLIGTLKKESSALKHPRKKLQRMKNKQKT